jgi:hypothetical protein
MIVRLAYLGYRPAQFKGKSENYPLWTGFEPFRGMRLVRDLEIAARLSRSFSEPLRLLGRIQLRWRERNRRA